MLNKKDIEKIGQILNIENIGKYSYFHKDDKHYELRIKNKCIGFSKMKILHDKGYNIIFSAFNTLDIY